jgi:SAM-dependent methyltransferase
MPLWDGHPGWARRGARVTGVDFSPPAVRAARSLAHELGIDARFVESNLYEVARRVGGRFDVVFTGKGAICWLPDLIRWGKIVSRFVRPGGRFFLLEDHPVAEIFGNDRTEKRLRLQYRYFRAPPIRDEPEGTYAAPEARRRNALSFAGIHPLSSVLDALIDSGLRIESAKEYPYTYWRRFSFLRPTADGYWHQNAHEGSIPLMYSALARKP